MVTKSGGAGNVEVRLFGRTTIEGESGAVRPSAPKQRQILALLALRPGRVVGVDRMVDELWGPTPPRSAVTAVQTYVYSLRKLIGACDAPPQRSVLVTVGPGYLLDVDAVDVFTFCRTVDRARTVGSSSPSEAASLLAGVLDTIDGAPLADVRRGASLRADAAWIDERVMAAQRLAIDLQMQLGR